MSPSWNLFIISFIVIVLSFSLIIGLTQTIKIMFNTYISIIVSEGIGEMLRFYFNSKLFLLKDVGVIINEDTMIIIKIVIFILIIILLTLLPIYDVNIAIPSSNTLKITFNVIYGVFLSLIFITAILLYLSGTSLLFPNISTVSYLRESLINQSQYANFIIQISPACISLPFFMIIYSAFKTKK